MNALIDLPQTPRQALDALEGKRPDLLLAPGRGCIRAETFLGDNHPGGECPLIIAVYQARTGGSDLAVPIGGLN